MSGPSRLGPIEQLWRTTFQENQAKDQPGMRKVNFGVVDCDWETFLREATSCVVVVVVAEELKLPAKVDHVTIRKW
jgi:hypothetical protein